MLHSNNNIKQKHITEEEAQLRKPPNHQLRPRPSTELKHLRCPEYRNLHLTMSLRHLTITLLSASMAFAAPSRTLNARQALSSGAAAVNDNIQGWQDNIANVNGFLNMFANGTETSQAVASAAAFLVVDKPGTAANEPDRLMALSGLIDPSNTTAVGAATDLMSIFGGVLGNLSIIVDNPNDLDVQTSAVEAINCLR